LINFMNEREPSLLQGFLLCLWDSEAVRMQTSRWKRSLLVFSSGVCLELAALPLAMTWFGFEVGPLAWLLTCAFLPLGLLGFYASSFGGDRLVERLLVVSHLDLNFLSPDRDL
jgi:hypothetical protein